MALNFMRSAKAPTTRAGVMMMKVIWNITKTASGIVPLTVSTEGASKDDESDSLSPKQRREKWVREFLAEIEMEEFADAIVAKGFGSKKRLLRLNEGIVRREFPSMASGDVLALISELEKLKCS